MKLNKKIMVLLATCSMVLTTPVVYASDYTDEVRLSRSVTVANDTEFTESNAPYLIIDSEDMLKNDVFFIDLKDAEWLPEKDSILPNVEGAEVRVLDETTARVTIQDPETVEFVLRIPLLTKVNGTATAKVSDNHFYLKNTEVTFAKTRQEDHTFDISIDSVPTFYDYGKLSDITLSEKLVNSTVGRSERDRTVYLTLEDPNFSFNLPSDNKLDVEFSYGYFGEDVTVYADYTENDHSEIKFILPEINSNSNGKLIIKNLKVEADDDPDEDDLALDIEGTLINGKNNLVVAHINEYGIEVDSEEKDVIAGQTEDMKFNLDTLSDSLVAGRHVDFNLNMGFFIELDSKRITKQSKLELLQDAFDSIEIKENDNPKSEDKSLDPRDVITDVYTTNIDDVEYITGFEFEIPETVGTYEFKIPVSYGLNDEGTAKIEITGRDIPKDLDVTIAKVQKAIDTSFTATKIKVGKQGQKGGSLTISETDENILQRGYDLVISLDGDDGLSFHALPKVVVTEGDIVLGDIEKVGTNIIIPIKRSSSEPSTIEINDFDITCDRTVPQGSFDLLIRGDALTEFENQKVKVKDFVVITTLNTEDIEKQDSIPTTAENATKIVQFMIDKPYYLLNDKPIAMQAAPYVSYNQRIMVPIRYLANAIGVDENSIMYANGVATIMYKDKIIQLERNSNVLKLNTMEIPLSEHVTMQNGRTYVPVGEIARCLGITVNWDVTSQTATFYVK